MLYDDAANLEEGDRVFWKNPVKGMPNGDTDCAGKVTEVIGSKVRIVWDDGKGCICDVWENSGFWANVERIA